MENYFDFDNWSNSYSCRFNNPNLLDENGKIELKNHNDPVTLKVLRFQGPKIEFIHHNIWNIFPSVKGVIFDNNEVEDFQKFNLHDCSKEITYIKISNQKFTYLPSNIFGHCINLRLLEIINNPVFRTVQSGAFCEISKVLREINFASNCIEGFDPRCNYTKDIAVKRIPIKYLFYLQQSPT